jgi:hypothetical protein
MQQRHVGRTESRGRLPDMESGSSDRQPTKAGSSGREAAKQQGEAARNQLQTWSLQSQGAWQEDSRAARKGSQKAAVGWGLAEAGISGRQAANQ